MLRAIRALMLSVLLLANVFASAAFADAKFITDLKYVNLYSKPNKASETLMYLPSGSKVNVVYEGQHFAKVKTTEGVTGWVSSGHLDPAKPALIKQLEIQKELDQAKRQMIEERKQHVKAVEGLRDDLARQRSTIAAGGTPSCPPVEKKECPDGAVPVASDKPNTGVAKTSPTKTKTSSAPAKDVSLMDSFKNPVVLGVMGGLFILGFILGWAFFDWRRRRRYGGFRI